MSIVAEAPAGLRERKKARTRAALHEAAVELAAASELPGVTVEAICAAAQVSARTFFNYYPSKAAAVLGLPDTRIPDAAREAFLTARGNPVHDLCDLTATVLGGTGRPDKAAIHALVQRYPELQHELHGWLADTRRGFSELVEQRLPVDDARAALVLVMAAVGDLTRSEQPVDLTGDGLWQRVQRMAALVVAPA